MRVPWEEAQDMILPHVNGCEWPFARLMLIQAARQFYTQTHAWRESCAPLNTAAGVADYDVLDVRETSVIALRDTYVGHRHICRHLTPEQYRHERARGCHGDAVAWIDDRLWLLPVPNRGGELIRATTILQPRMRSTGIPRELFELHGEALADGALAKIYESPGKPYSDGTMAGYRLGKFQDSLGVFRDRADTGGADVVVRTVPRYF